MADQLAAKWVITVARNTHDEDDEGRSDEGVDHRLVSWRRLTPTHANAAPTVMRRMPTYS
jgi:hypothetical protein